MDDNEDVVEFINDNPFGDVSTSVTGGIESKNNSTSCQHRSYQTVLPWELPPVQAG